MIAENDIPNADPSELIEQYKRFIFKLATRYQNILKQTGAVSLEDLHQVGFMAICEAQKTYEPGQGSFMNWLSWHARKAMRETIGINSNTGKAPPILSSLDAPLPGADNEDTSLIDTIPDSNILPFEETIIEDETKQETIKQIHDAVSRLKSATQREIVERVHFAGETKESAADAMGIKLTTFYEYERYAREKLRRDSELKQFVSGEIPFFHVGVARFNSTWISAVEKAVIWRDEHIFGNMH